MEIVKFHQNFVLDFWAQTFPISSIYMLPKLQTKIIRNALDVLNLYISKITKKKKNQTVIKSSFYILLKLLD